MSVPHDDACPQKPLKNETMADEGSAMAEEASAMMSEASAMVMK
jgi:hypothetical protein